MHTLLISFGAVLMPCLALADPQCALPASSAALAGGLVPKATQLATSAAAPTPAVRSTVAAIGTPALDHVVAAGAQIMDLGAAYGLRTVIARNEGQFMRMYVTPDGHALVAGLMADLSVAHLLEMARGQVTELGTLHGLRGLFVRNGGQFQVFYATPDEERVIPGAMWDAQGRNLTRDQVTSIPGTIPTVVIGDAPSQAGQSVVTAAQAPIGSLLKAVEGTTYGTVGSQAAPRLWVLADPLCAWSVRAMEQLRPFVAGGRLQLAVIPVAVLDREPQGRSTLAAKAMLSLPQDAMVAAWDGNKLAGPAKPEADRRLAASMAASAAIGLRGTPTFVWRKTDGTEGREDGMPKDVDAFIASIGR